MLVYGDVTSEQILNEIRKLTGDGSNTLKKLNRPGKFAAFKVCGRNIEVKRLKSADMWPAVPGKLFS